MKFAAPLVLLLACLLSGCTSYSARTTPGADLGERQRFFVRSNLNDSHAIDRHIAAALTSRGRSAEVGPLTMMPADAQVVVEYEDKWVWDFGEHLVAMNITMKEPKSGKPLGSTFFTARMSMIRDPSAVVARMVDELLKARTTPAR